VTTIGYGDKVPLTPAGRIRDRAALADQADSGGHDHDKPATARRCTRLGREAFVGRCIRRGRFGPPGYHCARDSERGDHPYPRHPAIAAHPLRSKNRLLVRQGPQPGSHRGRAWTSLTVVDDVACRNPGGSSGERGIALLRSSSPTRWSGLHLLDHQPAPSKATGVVHLAHQPNVPVVEPRGGPMSFMSVFSRT
jgi:hypothetical protein